MRRRPRRRFNPLRPQAQPLPEGVRDPRITQGVTPRRPPLLSDDEYEEDLSNYIEVRYPDGNVIYVDPSLIGDALFDLLDRRLVIAYTPDEIRRATGELGW